MLRLRLLWQVGLQSSSDEAVQQLEDDLKLPKPDKSSAQENMTVQLTPQSLSTMAQRVEDDLRLQGATSQSNLEETGSYMSPMSAPQPTSK